MVIVANDFVLTDSYQISMAYAYWKNDRANDPAVFDLFFRKNPFTGEFTIFAGLSECLKYLENFFFSESGTVALTSNLLTRSYCRLVDITVSSAPDTFFLRFTYCKFQPFDVKFKFWHNFFKTICSGMPYKLN